MTEGDKAKGIVHGEIGNQMIVVEIAGNNRYLAVTEDTVYVGSIGIASGSFFGKKVKKYPLDTISSVDVRKALLTVELELVTAGSVESGTTQGFMSRAQNENITVFAKGLYDEVQDVANRILSLRRELIDKGRQSEKSTASIPDQIEQLAGLRDKGILTDEEFQTKKQELLDRL